MKKISAMFQVVTVNFRMEDECLMHYKHASTINSIFESYEMKYERADDAILKFQNKVFTISNRLKFSCHVKRYLIQDNLMSSGLFVTKPGIYRLSNLAGDMYMFL